MWPNDHAELGGYLISPRLIALLIIMPNSASL